MFFFYRSADLTSNPNSGPLFDNPLLARLSKHCVTVRLPAHSEEDLAILVQHRCPRLKSLAIRLVRIFTIIARGGVPSPSPSTAATTTGPISNSDLQFASITALSSSATRQLTVRDLLRWCFRVDRLLVRHAIDASAALPEPVLLELVNHALQVFVLPQRSDSARQTLLRVIGTVLFN